MFVLLVPAFKFVTDLFGVGVNCWLVFSLLVQFVVMGLLVVKFVFGMVCVSLTGCLPWVLFVVLLPILRVVWLGVLGFGLCDCWLQLLGGLLVLWVGVMRV